MSVAYKCPNPDCGASIKSPTRVPAGKSVKCPKCGKPFVPEAAAADEAAPPPAATLKFADEPTPPKPPPEPAKKSRFDDDDDESAESVKKGYGVIGETEEEKKEAEKNKPKFTELQEKFKKSARGPAQALLVMPSNLLVGEGLLTILVGIVIFVASMWPLVFNDAPPGEEELEESIVGMLVGLVIAIWGGIVCFGASQMQELGSYPLAMVGAIMGVLPLLVGIFSIVMLQNPKVKAGFEEGEGGPDEDEEGEKKDDDEDDDEDGDDDGGDDDDDDDDDDGDDDESKAKKVAKKAGKKVGKKLLKGVFGGGDDE